jgi:hypothetical protein
MNIEGTNFRCLDELETEKYHDKKIDLTTGSCSDWPDCSTGREKNRSHWDGTKWEEWHKNVSKKHPIRHWLAEDGRKTSNTNPFPADLFDSIRRYVRNRWVDKIHCLNTGLKPGSYYDL